MLLTRKTTRKERVLCLAWLTSLMRKIINGLSPDEVAFLRVKEGSISSALKAVAQGEYPTIDYGDEVGAPGYLSPKNKTEHTLAPDITYVVKVKKADGYGGHSISIHFVDSTQDIEHAEFTLKKPFYLADMPSEKAFISLGRLFSCDDIQEKLEKALTFYICRNGRLEVSEEKDDIVFILTCGQYQAIYRLGPNGAQDELRGVLFAP